MMDVPEYVIKMAARGDKTAFEEIYRLASGYTYAVAFRVSGNREDAQEVVQDVFVSLYRNLWKFKFKAKFKTWIYRITVNTAINYYNKAKKKRTHEIGNEILAGNKGVLPDVESDIDSEYNKEAVASLLDVLNPDQRACIVLRELEGLSYEEISKILKINMNTVRTRLKRAREALVRHIQGKGGSDEMR